MIKKLLMEDPGCKLEDVVQHAVWARNMEIGRYGQSPFQIVFGTEPFIPRISKGNIITDRDITEEEVICEHFINQDKARIEIRRADSSRRLKDALKTIMQEYHDFFQSLVMKSYSWTKMTSGLVQVLYRQWSQRLSS